MLQAGSTVCADATAVQTLNDTGADCVSRDTAEPRRLNLPTEFDFPPLILDRLLASEIVPFEAKVKAVDSWRRELAGTHSNAPGIRELERRLARASRVLKWQRASKWSKIGLRWLTGRMKKEPPTAIIERPTFTTL